jgi:2-polyprenyl-3-methyl-5-hydroxy-6-metoxy-1,4-benzoquinol methylase
MTVPNEGDPGLLNTQVRDIWNQNAAFWDEHMGPQGNDFHRLLVGPVAERLLQIEPGDTVLEVACGAGIFARRLADLGASVLATDFSERFIERARARSQTYAEQIEFRVLDATDEREFRALGENPFDAVVANMALMDRSDIQPLAAALPHLLRPAGRFVFTVMHPCFNTSGCTMLVEQEETGGTVSTTYSVRVKRYLGLAVDKAFGILGQPAAQYYFHRPLHQLLGPFLAAGLVLDGVEEPAFDESVASGRQTSWSGNFHEIPPVLAVRLRRR